MTSDNAVKALPSNNTSEVRLPWLDVARRLQSCARATGALSLISITILVDADGMPRAWLEPNVRKIEPRKAQTDILAIMAASGKQFDGKF